MRNRNSLYKKILQQHAISLAELLIATFILTLVFCGVLMIFIQTLRSTELSWQITAATSHGQMILERIQQDDSIDQSFNRQWDKWLEDQQLVRLPEEKISVLWPKTLSWPIDVQVQVNWQHHQHTQNIELTTRIAK